MRRYILATSQTMQTVLFRNRDKTLTKFYCNFRPTAIASFQLILSHFTVALNTIQTADAGFSGRKIEK